MAELLCPACGSRTEAWAPGPGGRPDARCPACQSLERHRFLAWVIRAAAAHRPRQVRTVVDCAPHPQIRRVLRDAFPDARYVGLDLLEPDRHIDVLADLTRAPFADGSADLLVCYHVLEHIPDDRRAMRELRRVLAGDGLAVLQVPYRPTATTDEDPSASPEERTQRFGQADHVRWYGRDFDDRLREVGFDLRRHQPTDLVDDDAMRRHGIADREPVWLASADDTSWARAVATGLADTPIRPIGGPPDASRRAGIARRIRRRLRG